VCPSNGYVYANGSNPTLSCATRVPWNIESSQRHSEQSMHYEDSACHVSTYGWNVLKSLQFMWCNKLRQTLLQFKGQISVNILDTQQNDRLFSDDWIFCELIVFEIILYKSFYFYSSFIFLSWVIHFFGIYNVNRKLPSNLQKKFEFCDSSRIAQGPC